MKSKLFGSAAILLTAVFSVAGQAPKTPIRLPSFDLNPVTSLPFLGQAVPDRPSLVDATMGAAIQAALKERPPGRTTPAAFSPQSLPDPFENSQVIRLRNELDERSDPFVPPLRPLAK